MNLMVSACSDAFQGHTNLRFWFSLLLMLDVRFNTVLTCCVPR